MPKSKTRKGRNGKRPPQQKPAAGAPAGFERGGQPTNPKSGKAP